MQDTDQRVIQGVNDDDEIEIDLWELFLAFRKHVLAIILAGLIGGILGFGISKVALTPVYTSTSMIYVMGNENIISSLADLQIGAQLTQDYKVLVTNRSVMEKVIGNLELDIDYKNLRRKIKLDNPQNTRILKIAVNDTDPIRAKKITDEVAKCASQYIADIMEQDPPKIIEDGEVPTSKTSPSNSKNALIAALLGVLGAMGMITLNVLMNDSVKTEDDIRSAIGSSVLAVVPMHADEEEERKRRHHRHEKKNRDDSADLGGGV
ncbi:MAG: polysaccharide export protein [Lachnospiraceae bacterium]|nr:polysaccharide export protein [Lachnospiraceae bacterium]